MCWDGKAPPHSNRFSASAFVTFLCKSLRTLVLSKFEIFGVQPSLWTDFASLCRILNKKDKPLRCAAKNALPNMVAIAAISDFGSISFIIVPVSATKQFYQNWFGCEPRGLSVLRNGMLLVTCRWIMTMIWQNERHGWIQPLNTRGMQSSWALVTTPYVMVVVYTACAGFA